MAEKGEILPEHLLLQVEIYKGRDLEKHSDKEAFLFDPEKSMNDYEKDILLRTLEYYGGNKSKAARQLGVSRLTLHNKIKEYEEKAL